MLGLVLHHPWAWFTMPRFGLPPRKRLETRGLPIGGLPGAPKSPTLPGCNAEPGERVAIIAGADRVPYRQTVAGGGHGDVTAEQEATMAAELRNDGVQVEVDLPWGAVLGTVRLGAALPMVEAPAPNRPGQLVLDDGKLCLDVEGGWRNIGHEQPYGVWAPGRWAVELDDAVRLREPVPILGRQGLHHLRDTTDHGVRCPRCADGTMLTTCPPDGEEHDWCPSCGWVDE